MFSPTGGLIGTVALACSNLPAGANCSFSSSTLTADGSDTAQTAKLTIATSALAANSHTGVFFASLLGLGSLFALRRKRTLPALFTVVGALLALAGLAR